MALAHGNCYPASTPSSLRAPLASSHLGIFSDTNLYICTGIRKDGPATVAGLFTSEEAAAKFADVLGLAPTSFTRHEGPCEDATDKLRDLWTALMPCEYEDPTDPIICAFCAKFLPSLISAYKTDPCVNGPHHWMLLAVLQSNSR
ncbi:hypothetical protein B0H14DRAFT_3128736 [Mycena olivaceomarginata]|nr:hypothetical protein B0H14DRAFT_3128736 [Mycena olivaceomarginata]